MLTLKNIKKDYFVADTTVHALKDVSLSFRNNEFVSILGPSGCGKTTLLNIIGGLDKYTSGDLIIDNVSTKNYNDRDWDTYRNHRVGFVFQSYNLIPHQSILENVELALNISGIEKKERVKRAKQALDKVGLAGQYNKKPNQLSGGQCQRVAIARALVNDPEILLADEPTGALDTVTSKQIMDLIQEISKDCLVIMVTHNPEIAEEYSTRIIKLLDGEVTQDSNPFDETQEVIQTESNTKSKKKKTKKSKLSFWSAFRLSARNLWSKFKRTFMVCLAGSIGIIGVASVLAVSTGVQNMINNMQDDMLSGNPITITEEALNLNALMESSNMMMSANAIKHSIEDGYVNVDYIVDYLVKQSDSLGSMIVTNDITEDYIKFVHNMPKEYYSAITTNYGIDITNNIYTNFNFNNQENNKMSLSAAIQLYNSMLGKTDYKSFSAYITTLSDTFMQAPDNEDFILSQYDILTNPETSKIASKSNEIMLVLSDDNTLTDIFLAQLGYYSQDEFFNIIYKATEDNRYNENLLKDKISYDELIGKTFTWYPNNTVFNKTDSSLPTAASNPFSYNAYENESWTTGKELTITAILKTKEDISYGCLDTGIYYTTALAEEIIQDSLNSEIVEYLNENNISTFPHAISENLYAQVMYTYNYEFDGQQYNNNIGIVGKPNQMSSLMGSMGDAMSGNSGQGFPTVYYLSLRDVGGCTLPNKIEIYPTDFDHKNDVTKYLDLWNSENNLVIDGKTLTDEQRADIQYSDNLALVISLINTLIDAITTALVAFTSLSLVVSTVMVAIITYVSVIERIKEIGVIRSLGGRKRDVSNLFIAETVIIGGLSGLFGILVTYGLVGIINLITGSLLGLPIACLKIPTALIMITISIVLTLISGVVPARLAAKKDPVVALRTE